MYIRPKRQEGHHSPDLLYFGQPIQPSTSVWNLSDMFPNEVNDISPGNMKEKSSMSVGTGMTAQEAHNAALERLEKRVLNGDYDCIAIVSSLPMKSDATFYCYVCANLYKFKKRDWKHPVRLD